MSTWLPVWASHFWSWWSGFPVGFGLTCVIELPAYLVAFVALGWCRRWPPPGTLGVLPTVALALAVNLITHPVLWAVAQRLQSDGALLTAEVGVALVEGLAIFAVVRRLAGPESPRTRLRWSVLFWSVLAATAVNALSLLLGSVLLGPATGFLTR